MKLLTSLQHTTPRQTLRFRPPFHSLCALCAQQMSTRLRPLQTSDHGGLRPPPCVWTFDSAPLLCFCGWENGFNFTCEVYLLPWQNNFSSLNGPAIVWLNPPESISPLVLFLLFCLFPWLPEVASFTNVQKLKGPATVFCNQPEIHWQPIRTSHDDDDDVSRCHS